MDDKERRWTEMYWDVFSEIRWSPGLIGMESFKGWECTVGKDGELPTKTDKKPKRSVYRQTILRDGEKDDRKVTEHVMRQERGFNGLLDLVVGLTPGVVLSDLFDPFVGLNDRHDYRAFGRDLHTRFDNGSSEIGTQQDGFLTASNSILAIEIKFGASTSLGQLAKYCLLMLLEEERTGQRDSLSLLYIVPKERINRISEKIGCSLQTIDGGVADEVIETQKGRNFRLLSERREALVELLDRLRVRVISWGDLANALRAKVNQLGDSDGDRTLANLLVGFADEIEANPETGTTQ